jgi:hypothetical protein
VVPGTQRVTLTTGVLMLVPEKVTGIWFGEKEGPDEDPPPPQEDIIVKKISKRIPEIWFPEFPFDDFFLISKKNLFMEWSIFLKSRLQLERELGPRPSLPNEESFLPYGVQGKKLKELLSHAQREEVSEDGSRGVCPAWGDECRTRKVQKSPPMDLPPGGGPR